MTTKYEPTGKGNPCPICGRGGAGAEKQGGDCRTIEFGNVVLCHTETSKTDDIGGYKFAKATDKGAGWGVWVWAKQDDKGRVKGLKDRPKIEQRQTFDYPDRDGNPLIRVVRQKGGNIDFYQEYFVDGVWLSAGKVDDQVKAKMRAAVPIYRYHEVRAAVERGDSIYFCEGESCADALWSAGIPATTTIGGSKGYRQWGSYKADLDGAQIVLCPDRDKEGVAYVDDVAKDFPQHSLYKAFKTSPVWQFLPDCGGLDVADELASGVKPETILGAAEKAVDGIKSRVLKLREEIEKYIAEPDPATRMLLRTQVCIEYRISKQDFIDQVVGVEQARIPTKKTRFSASEFFAQAEEAIQYRFNRYLPVGEHILLASAAGVGKTNIITDAVHSALSGEDFLGENCLAPCRVLFISSDESEHTTRRRMLARGTDMIAGDRLEVWTDFDITKLDDLEQFLATWKPDLVCMDSITTICQNVGISEKDPEFAMHLYKLKNLWSRYNCSAIITHHANKDPMAKGLGKVSGSARIPAAFWGVFLLDRSDDNPENPIRWLHMVKGREVQEFKVKLMTNPRSQWSELGVFAVTEDEDRRENRNRRDYILNYLKEQAAPLEFVEIQQAYNYPDSTLYRILDRLVADRIVIKRRSKTNYKKWVYLVQNFNPTPPNSFCSGNENETARSFTGSDIPSFSLHSQDGKTENETVVRCESEKEGENDGNVCVAKGSAVHSHMGKEIAGGGVLRVPFSGDTRSESLPGDAVPQKFQRHSGASFAVGDGVQIVDRSHPNAYQIGSVAEVQGMNGSSRYLVKAYDGSFTNWAKANQLKEFNVDEQEEVDE
jgi:hypothetical protein